MSKVTINDQTVDFDAAVNLMDDDIREELHSSRHWTSDQEFADAYVEAHKAKFSEDFQVA